jgi:hypothetical protein
MVLFISNILRNVGYYQRHTAAIEISILEKKNLADKGLPKMEILIAVVYR